MSDKRTCRQCGAFIPVGGPEVCEVCAPGDDWRLPGRGRGRHGMIVRPEDVRRLFCDAVSAPSPRDDYPADWGEWREQMCDEIDRLRDECRRRVMLGELFGPSNPRGNPKSWADIIAEQRAELDRLRAENERLRADAYSLQEDVWSYQRRLDEMQDDVL